MNMSFTRLALRIAWGFVLFVALIVTVDPLTARGDQPIYAPADDERGLAEGEPLKSPLVITIGSKGGSPKVVPLFLSTTTPGVPKGYSSEFYLILRNTTDKQITISYIANAGSGTGTIEFVFRDDAGKDVLKLNRPGREDFPIPIDLEPNEPAVIPIMFRPEETEQIAKLRDRTVRLSVIYRASGTGGHWMGTATSNERSFHLRD